MARYTLAVGTHDPEALSADSVTEAVREAVSIVRNRYGDNLRSNPAEVATLLGPTGLITRPSERIDEFVARSGQDPEAESGPLRTGDAGAPDCNSD